MTIYNLHQFTDAPIGAHDIMGAAPFVQLPALEGTGFFQSLTGGLNLRHLMRNPAVRRRHVVEATCWMIGGLILAAIDSYLEGR